MLVELEWYDWCFSTYLHAPLEIVIYHMQDKSTFNPIGSKCFCEIKPSITTFFWKANIKS